MQNHLPSLQDPLPLLCGVVLKNRFAKSAMSEQLGGPSHAATPALATLYRRWAEGGTGLLVTGHVMIDSRALGEPRNVVVENEQALDKLQAWAEAARVNETHVWMQLNHPGRQSPRNVSPVPVAPSAVPLKLPGNMFAPPRALTGDEIRDLIRRFANSARIARKAGFTGVQIHGAHGYLVSQFLSPLANLRTDEWGGNPENRRRFVLEAYRAIRGAVGASFGVGIKLNSADFQRGGFTEEESLDVVKALEAEGIDLIEISGGTYERPAMMTGGKKSTEEREAYFIDFAHKVRKATNTPVMLTGGFRTKGAMERALLTEAADIIGMARPLALEPDLPNRILSGKSQGVGRMRSPSLAPGIDGFTETFWYGRQLRRMAGGKNPDPRINVWTTMALSIAEQGLDTFRRKRPAK